VRDLCREALAAAAAAGAEYADARCVLRRAQSVATRNGRVDTVTDAESEGIGVRVLVAGAWGFACDRRLTAEGARGAAARACAFARAASSGNARQLAPAAARGGTYRTPVDRDPFAVPLGDKIELCLRAEAALAHEDVKVTSASVHARREQKVLVSSDGAVVEQELVETGGGVDAIATRDGVVQQRSYPSAHGSASAAGWEHVEALGLEREAPRVGEQAAALVRAVECRPGRTTIVVDAEQMGLQVHESVGHPIELDRVYGTEAAYAGTSFLSPGDLGTLRYGSPVMHVTADSTTPHGLGTFAFDDEGVAAGRETIVEEGTLRAFLTSRETAARIGPPARGGSMRADGWNRLPLVRMTNLHLEPGAGTLEDLLADVDEGVYFETNKSWSIDDKRLNFQFGTQIAWEIRGGRLGRMLRDATYTGITPVFWGSLDAVAGPGAWRLHGLTNCGKGQPGQSAHVSHGAAPARFRDVEVGVHP
jgi:TldD protein